MRRIGSLLLVAALAAPACGSAADGGSASQAGRIVPGSPARFEEKLESLRGKPVVVNFWGSWCIPCREEMPRIVAAAKRYGKDVHFLGVDVQDDQASAEAFARRYRMPFTSLADPGKKIVRAEGLLGLPVTQFYRADGDLAFVHNGPIDRADLTENIEQLLLVSRTAEPEN